MTIKPFTLFVVCLLWALLVIGELPALAQTPVSNDYQVIDLGTLQAGANSWATGINAKGQIAGYSIVSATAHSFLYSNGSMQDITGPGDFNSRAYGINNSGQVVGTFRLPVSTGDPTLHFFIYSNGLRTDLGSLNDIVAVTASSINDSGHIVGQYSDPVLNSYQAFSYWSGVIQDVDTSISDYSGASAVNANDQVVGSFEGGTSPYYSFAHAFLYSNGSAKDLGTLGGNNSAAYGINNVSGWAATPSFQPWIMKSWLHVFFKKQIRASALE